MNDRLDSLTVFVSKVSLSGRVRDDATKKLLAKQLGSLGEDIPRFDIETGQIKSKKAKKEKTPQEIAVNEMKQFEKKLLSTSSSYSSLL